MSLFAIPAPLAYLACRSRIAEMEESPVVLKGRAGQAERAEPVAAAAPGHSVGSVGDYLITTGNVHQQCSSTKDLDKTNRRPAGVQVNMKEKVWVLAEDTG
ncbi:hypothetical protein INR49_015377 [Caranx melampygus]|nr:hypothetical protein INR49_015377 [Caranx melampygus]